jgi:hypothetical protein
MVPAVFSLPLLAHLGIHSRGPWRRLSGVVLSRIGLALWAGLWWWNRPKSGGTFPPPEYVIMCVYHTFGRSMPALKEPQRITLPEALTILERDLPTEQGKLRLRQAFIQKAFRQEPLFALSYDEADIDWTTGSVKIPRKRDRFCPTFLRSDFNALFFCG